MTDTAPVAKPTPVGGGLAVLAALVTTAMAVGTSGMGAVLALAGLATLLIGLVVPRPGIVTLGGLGLVGAVLAAGVAGASGMAVAVGIVGAVVSWDIAHNSLSLARQVGREGSTAAPEALHAGASLFVGVGATAVGYLIFTSVGSGQPATAVALLTIGAVMLLLAVK